MPFTATFYAWYVGPAAHPDTAGDTTVHDPAPPIVTPELEPYTYTATVFKNPTNSEIIEVYNEGSIILNSGPRGYITREILYKYFQFTYTNNGNLYIWSKKSVIPIVVSEQVLYDEEENLEWTAEGRMMFIPEGRAWPEDDRVYRRPNNENFPQMFSVRYYSETTSAAFSDGSLVGYSSQRVNINEDIGVYFSLYNRIKPILLNRFSFLENYDGL